MKKILVLALTAGFSISAAFAYEAVMDKIMKSWLGYNVDNVISRWGYPKEEKTIAGHKLYIWSKGTTTEAYSPNPSHTEIHQEECCTRTFEIDDENRIVNWQWEGSECPVLYILGKSWVNPDNNPWAKK